MKASLIKNIFKVFMLGIFLQFTSCVNNTEEKTYESAEEIPASREMIAELTSPPNVPAAVGRRKAKSSL